jgi:hypothetical protein
VYNIPFPKREQEKINALKKIKDEIEKKPTIILGAELCPIALLKLILKMAKHKPLLQQANLYCCEKQCLKFRLVNTEGL